MKKCMSLMLASTLTIGAIYGTAPANVMAAEHNKSSAVKDINDTIVKMIKSDQGWGQFYEKHTLNDFDVKASNILSSIIEDTEVLKVHDSYLTNNTPLEQTMSSAAYEHEFTETTSTTNTTGWTFGYEYNVGASIWVVSASHTFKVDYNMSTDKTTETSVSRKLIAPSQNIIVPAGKTYKLNYVFEKVTISGKNNIIADVYGKVYYRNVPGLAHSLGQTWAWASDKQGLKLVYRDGQQNPDPALNSGVEVEGIGEFRTDFGTKLYVEVEDITNPNKPVLVETREIPVEFKSISEDTRVVE
ncbi:ETX/MTX2 family pore-forming toxin [Brevibacterium sp. JNUCC-42]|nr:ETX/MTX2 family pore-forming toxin [Brevibacterium sp. JNUCC-42]